MLKEFIEFVSDQAIKAAGAHKLPSVDPRVDHFLMPNGQLVPLEIIAPLRNYTVADLETIVHLYRDEDAHEDAQSVIWVADDRVVLVLDVTDRREQAVYMFGYSDQFRAVSERLVKRVEGFTQAELCKFLRLKLGLEESIVGRFRALQWSSGDDAQATVQRGVDKLGASIRREVINAAEIPEMLHVSLPVFDGKVEKEFTRTVTLLVELDAAQRLIWLVPRPGAMSDAVDTTLTSIQSWLSEAIGTTTDSMVYRGKPN